MYFLTINASVPLPDHRLVRAARLGGRLHRLFLRHDHSADCQALQPLAGGDLRVR